MRSLPFLLVAASLRLFICSACLSKGKLEVCVITTQSHPPHNTQHTTSYCEDFIQIIPILILLAQHYPSSPATKAAEETKNSLNF